MKRGALIVDQADRRNRRAASGCLQEDSLNGVELQAKRVPYDREWAWRSGGLSLAWGGKDRDCDRTDSLALLRNGPNNDRRLT